MGEPRIIVALDSLDVEEVLRVAERLSPLHCRLKIGKALFTMAGPALVDTLQQRDYQIFLDLKFHDIPNTVAQACRAAARLGVWMLDVHASGGEAMLRAARHAIEEAHTRPLLVAVTVLTSLQGRDDLKAVGVDCPIGSQVSRLAGLVEACGLDGVVCSGDELLRLRDERSSNFCLVTPGIRPLDQDHDDQRRVMTPTQAIAAGSDYLVVGRPVTRAADPMQALLRLEEDIARQD